MRILILTQKVNTEDDVLGFFPRWVDEFSKQCTSVEVVCLEKGAYEAPQNVKVFSLGKESGAGRVAQMGTFYKIIFRERNNYDAVFVHMNPIYVVLGGFLWRMWGKKIALWYSHKNVDAKLRIAEKFVHVIFSTAKESFRVSTKKLVVVGHGIDTQAFSDESMEKNSVPIILHAGRITPIKNLSTLIDAVFELKKTWQSSFKVVLVGAPMNYADEEYKTSLVEKIDRYDLRSVVEFAGSVPYPDMPSQYHRAAVSVNLAPTGGVDKAVLESMAAGTPVFVANEAFRGYFGSLAERFMFKGGDAHELARKISLFFESSDQKEVAKKLTDIVLEKAGIERLVRDILKALL